MAVGSAAGGTTTTGMSTASPSGGAAAPVLASAGSLLAIAETMIVVLTVDRRNPSTGAFCPRSSLCPRLTRLSPPGLDTAALPATTTTPGTTPEGAAQAPRFPSAFSSFSLPGKQWTDASPPADFPKNSARCAPSLFRNSLLV